MKIEVSVNQTIEVDVDEIVCAVNALDNKYKWNFVLNILKYVDLSQLEDKYKQQAKNYLEEAMKKIGT